MVPGSAFVQATGIGVEMKPAIESVDPTNFHASLKADKCKDYVRSQAINCETGAFDPEIAHAIAVQMHRLPLFVRRASSKWCPARANP